MGMKSRCCLGMRAGPGVVLVAGRKATRANEAELLPHLMSPSPGTGVTRCPLQAQDEGDPESLYWELEPGTCSVLISTVAAVALQSPRQAHHQPVAARLQLQPDRWSGGHHP